MLPSMPVLFPRDSQSVDSFIFKESPLAIFTEPPAPKLPPPTLKPKASGGKRKKDELLMLTADEENQHEIHYVQQYYNKICKLPVEKFTKFKDMLSNFCPGEESPALLYRQLETLLGEDELVEEFLTFLTPGQAAKVGRLMDHLALTKISKFIQHLQSALARKPAKLRKVIKAVTAAATSGSESDLRQKVEPLIRTNARLLQQFRTLFPSERPAESLYALEYTEEFPESAWASDCGYHRIEMEEEPGKSQKGDGDVTYLHGQVFIRQGRVLRPASVTFPGSRLQEHIDRLAPPRDQLLLLPATNTTVDSEDERRKKSPKRQKAPAKTRKDKNRSPERPQKNQNAVCKKTVRVLLDAQIDRMVKNEERDDAKGRRKTEHSLDDEVTKKRKRLDTKKTETSQAKASNQGKKVLDKRKGKAKTISDFETKSLTDGSRSHRKCSTSKDDATTQSIDKYIKDDKKLKSNDDAEVIEIMKTDKASIDKYNKHDKKLKSTDNEEAIEIMKADEASIDKYIKHVKDDETLKSADDEEVIKIMKTDEALIDKCNKNAKDDETLKSTDDEEAIEFMKTDEASIDKYNKNVKDDKTLKSTDDAEVIEIMKTDEAKVESGKAAETAEPSQQKNAGTMNSGNDDAVTRNESHNSAIEPNPKCSWTRSEDKTILLVLKAGSECEDTFLKMRELLPHRSLQELRERFVHVMDILQSMALGEPT